MAEKVALDICDALRVCHQNGVLHRDIKPANILCSDAGDFYLGDFGISKGTAQQASMTSSGTLEYAPREVMTGQYDHRADLYSLGLVLYALVNHWAGPFLPAYPAPITPGDRNQAQYARMNGTPLPPPDNCPTALWAVIARLCAFKPEERFDSAEAVLAALCDPGTPAPAPAPHRAHPNLPRIRHPRRLAAVVLVSAVAVGVGVGLYRRQQMAAPDISLGAGRDSTDAALAQASDLLQGNENFMTAHNLQFCSDRNVTIPGGALVYLTDPGQNRERLPRLHHRRRRRRRGRGFDADLYRRDRRGQRRRHRDLHDTADRAGRHHPAPHAGCANLWRRWRGLQRCCPSMPPLGRCSPA